MLLELQVHGTAKRILERRKIQTSSGLDTDITKEEPIFKVFLHTSVPKNQYKFQKKYFIIG